MLYLNPYISDQQLQIQQCNKKILFDICFLGPGNLKGLGIGRWLELEVGHW